MTEQKRDWKPGDVAMTNMGERVWHAGDSRWVYDNGIPSSLNLADPDYKTRPLVVIDPEDREQMNRLIKTVRDHYKGAGLGYLMAHQMFHEERVDTFAAALEEFANPTPPKPEEPGKYGAVLARDGREWMRYTDREVAGYDWIRVDGTGIPPHYARWSDLEVVRVLSEGVVQS